MRNGGTRGRGCGRGGQATRDFFAAIRKANNRSKIGSPHRVRRRAGVLEREVLTRGFLKERTAFPSHNVQSNPRYAQPKYVKHKDWYCEYPILRCHALAVFAPYLPLPAPSGSAPRLLVVGCGNSCACIRLSCALVWLCAEESTPLIGHHARPACSRVGGIVRRRVHEHR